MADQRKLYDLIWKRTLAQPMERRGMERTTVDVGSKDGQVMLRANGQVMLFRRLPAWSTRKAATTARNGRRQASAAQIDRARLPKSNLLIVNNISTPSPPRYTEATLVKAHGRAPASAAPSTYASIVTTIQDRGYGSKRKNRP